MVKHGLAHKHPLYGVWRTMRARCKNPNSIRYKYYGARGISVCIEWEDFATFYGWAKDKWNPGLQIDRIDTNGNYEPNNCRFVTPKSNSRNTRQNKIVSCFGETLTLIEAVEKYGKSPYGTILHRIRDGWSVEDALSFKTWKDFLDFHYSDNYYHVDETYKKLVTKILTKGEKKSNRTGTNTLSIFGEQVKFDLRKGFPLLTTKKTKFDLVVKELLWFLSGSTNINDLGCHIWDEWADSNGDCGPIYGKQWISWTGDKEDCYGRNVEFNQIQQAIELIKNNPDSRRIAVSAWNVADLPDMKLAPCHAFFQLNVSGKYLDLQLYQRSADAGLGVPFNIASYALLLTMLAKECNLEPRHFVHTFGDLHIYENHVDGLTQQLERKPYPMPSVEITNKPFWEIKEEDIRLVNYQHHPYIRLPIAV